jgi:hypothetical protein
MTQFGKIKSIRKETFSQSDWEAYDGYVIECENDIVKIGIDNNQSCCENWGYMSSNDEDLDYYVGADLLSVRVVDENLLKTKILEEGDIFSEGGGIMFVDVDTTRGVFQIAMYNDHDGYYGHDAVVITKESTICERL